MNKASNVKRQMSNVRDKARFTFHVSRFTLATFLLIVALAWGCKPSRQPAFSGHLFVSCADSALPLIEREARTFMTLYPGSRIEIIPTDSRGALVRLFSGEAGIAVISRDVGEDERRVAAEGGIGLHVYRIAIDGVAIIVNPRNRVDSLSVDQVAGLFGGKFVSWREVGGEDQAVVPSVRDRNSGTYEVIRRQVLGGTDPVRGVLCRTSQEVVDRVASEPGGIGCVGLAWLTRGRVKALRVAEKPGGAFVEAEAPSVYKNRYPLRRPFMICATDGPAEASLRAGFITFVTSSRGQMIVESEGLVPDTIPERIVELKREGLQ